MRTPRFLPEQSLPLTRIGTDNSSGKEVYVLEGLLNAELLINIKAHGFIDAFNVVLKDGTKVERCWLR